MSTKMCPDCNGDGNRPVCHGKGDSLGDEISGTRSAVRIAPRAVVAARARPAAAREKSRLGARADRSDILHGLIQWQYLADLHLTVNAYT
jgi:hypothetical protein